MHSKSNNTEFMIYDNADEVIEELSESLRKGNAQFIFLFNPQKSSVNDCLMKILKSTVNVTVNVFLQLR